MNFDGTVRRSGLLDHDRLRPGDRVRQRLREPGRRPPLLPLSGPGRPTRPVDRRAEVRQRRRPRPRPDPSYMEADRATSRRSSATRTDHRGRPGHPHGMIRTLYTVDDQVDGVGACQCSCSRFGQACRGRGGLVAHPRRLVAAVTLEVRRVRDVGGHRRRRTWTRRPTASVAPLGETGTRASRSFLDSKSLRKFTALSKVRDRRVTGALPHDAVDVHGDVDVAALEVHPTVEVGRPVPWASVQVLAGVAGVVTRLLEVPLRPSGTGRNRWSAAELPVVVGRNGR